MIIMIWHPSHINNPPRPQKDSANEQEGPVRNAGDVSYVVMDSSRGVAFV